jgi:predicted GNAT family acetyltransferase
MESNVIELKPESNLSLYGQYVIEREGMEIIETEISFVTYYFVEKECYIKDVFVKEEHRKTGEATRLGDEVAKIAKSKGCTKLYGTVCPTAKGSTESLKFLLAYGFKLDSSVANFIALVKELGV